MAAKTTAQGAQSLTGKNTPEKKIHVGNIHLAIWRNRSGDKTFYSISCEKRYLKDGKWNSSTSFAKNDLPKAILALQEAYKYLTMEAPPETMVEEGKEEYNDLKDRHQRFVEEESVG